VPTPVLAGVTVSADGTSVTFTWSNPDPVDGDTFLWTRTDPAAVDTVPRETTEGTATVDGVTPGTTVCLEIEILRAGQGSAVPLEECAP
jgi:eukaryotic-like serine/threonine-protein kinase